MGKLSIDLETCIMAGECVYNHPEYFAFGDDDYPVVLEPDVQTPEDEKAADEAMAVCPSQAIRLED